MKTKTVIRIAGDDKVAIAESITQHLNRYGYKTTTYAADSLGIAIEAVHYKEKKDERANSDIQRT